MDKGDGSWISCDRPYQCDLDYSKNPRISQPQKEEAQIKRGTDTSELNLKQNSLCECDTNTMDGME